MNTTEYDKVMAQVVELADRHHKYSDAIDLLQTLLDSDLPQVDRSVAALNIATMCEKLGHESHALQWFDHAIALERPFFRCLAAMQKATFLHRKGRFAESAEVYADLLTENYHTLHERAALEHNLLLAREAQRAK